MSSIQRNRRHGGYENLRSQNFICHAAQAKRVSVVGDFNKWNPTTHPMIQGLDKVWTLRTEMKHGHHRYAFHVDGQLVLDPLAMGVTRDDHGQRVSLIAVS